MKLADRKSDTFDIHAEMFNVSVGGRRLRLFQKLV